MFEARIKIELDFIYYCKYLEKKRVREFLVFSLVVKGRRRLGIKF